MILMNEFRHSDGEASPKKPRKGNKTIPVYPPKLTNFIEEPRKKPAPQPGNNKEEKMEVSHKSDNESHLEYSDPSKESQSRSRSRLHSKNSSSEVMNQEFGKK